MNKEQAMQTELKSGIEQCAVSESVEKIHKKGWHNNTLEWLSNCLQKPSPEITPSALYTRQNVRFIVTCALLFFVAFGVRLLHWQDMRVETLQEDTIATTLVGLYEKEAKRMEEDGGVVFPSRPVDAGDARMLVHPPGYAILLRSLYGTEHPATHYFALRMVQVVCDALSVVLLFLLVAEFFPLALAATGAMLAALSPHLAYYSLWLSPDSLVVLPILLGILFFIKASKRPSFATVIASGISFGLACWLRANPLLLAPLFALLALLVFERGKRLRYAAALLLTMMLVISPITIRNWVVYHRFIPLTIVTGLNLVQGLAEFDKEGKFGMPPMDADAMLKDAEWHQNPEYARNLFVPDGIERDRYRFRRGVEVIRENPGWFAKGMFLRMAFMLRYNDFRSQNNYAFTSIAPTVLPRPGFGHGLEVGENAAPVWANSASDMVANAERLSTGMDVSLTQTGRLKLIGNGLEHEEQLSPAPIAVKQETDYILTIPVSLEQSRADLKIRALDKRFTLQSKLAYHFSRRVKLAKNKAKDQPSLTGEASVDGKNGEPNINEERPLTLIQVPFSSGNNSEIRFVIANNEASDKTILEAGEAQLFEIGATPYQWTQLPRSIIIGLQKNLFKTNTMRLLLLTGLLLLAFARRRNALLILLAVPLYYLFTHAAFSTEWRYILAMHYFLFAIAATTIYVAGATLKQGFLLLLSKWKVKDRQPPASEALG
jgi:hypothetical protein